MTRNEIIAQLTRIAQSAFDKSDLVLTENMSKATVDSWTSVTFMQLLSSVEIQFGFKFKMMEIIQLQTMGDIIQSIEKHLV